MKSCNCFIERKPTNITEFEIKSPNAQLGFGASGAVARLKVCANLQVLRPSERQWKPRLPPYDFVVFSDNPHSSWRRYSETVIVQEYTMFEYNKEDLRKSIGFARYMSTIPPVVVTFYKDGIQTGKELTGPIMMSLSLTENKVTETPLFKKTETFLSLDKYENMREELKKQENTYVLADESNNKEYVLTWYEWEQ